MTTQLAVQLDDRLVKDAREVAAARGITLDEALTLALQEWIHACAPDPVPFKFPDFWEGEPPQWAEGVRPGMTYRELLDLMDEDEA